MIRPTSWPLGRGTSGGISPTCQPFSALVYPSSIMALAPMYMTLMASVISMVCRGYSRSMSGTGDLSSLVPLPTRAKSWDTSRSGASVTNPEFGWPPNWLRSPPVTSIACSSRSVEAKLSNQPGSWQCSISRTLANPTVAKSSVVTTPTTARHLAR
ncbi:unannotated protein [freshwater metagenome]|uniref:Unannotated protein n=1 Tax=freshwater metagenome TaxID=449393 RepID=A0A6J6YP82_9ZZZZ